MREANQQLAIGDDQQLKLLYVANDISAAKRAADAINHVTRQDFARLVTSDEPGALRTLRGAAKERRSLAIVSVEMVTEGFDCPEIATIAYATNIIADLFVAQTMARAMRITLAERTQRQMLPAQILIPDDPAMRRAFASALASALHMVDEPRDTEFPDPTGGNGDRLPLYQLLDLSDPRLRSATVLTQDDGEVKPTNSPWSSPNASMWVFPKPTRRGSPSCPAVTVRRCASARRTPVTPPPRRRQLPIPTLAQGKPSPPQTPVR